MKRGWFSDSWRHSMAARGIRTKNNYLKTKTQDNFRKNLAKGKKALDEGRPVTVFMNEDAFSDVDMDNGEEKKGVFVEALNENEAEDLTSALQQYKRYGK